MVIYPSEEENGVEVEPSFMGEKEGWVDFRNTIFSIHLRFIKKQ